jgi:hypothetical protein
MGKHYILLFVCIYSKHQMNILSLKALKNSDCFICLCILKIGITDINLFMGYYIMLRYGTLMQNAALY